MGMGMRGEGEGRMTEMRVRCDSHCCPAVRFVASSAAESGVLGNTEQLYMVKRIPRDMIQNTGAFSRTLRAFGWSVRSSP